MGAMQLANPVRVLLAASAVFLVSAVKTPDELAALRAQNPYAYNVVQSLLLKNKMGVLNPRHPSVALSAPEEEPRDVDYDNSHQPSEDPSMFEALDSRRPSALLSVPKHEVEQADDDEAIPLSPAPAMQGVGSDWMNSKPADVDEEVQGVMSKIDDLAGKSVSLQQTSGAASGSDDILGDVGRTPALPGSPPAPASIDADSRLSFRANPYLADLGLGTASTGLATAPERHVTPAVQEPAQEQQQEHPKALQVPAAVSSSLDKLESEEEAMFEEALNLPEADLGKWAAKKTAHPEFEESPPRHAVSAPVQKHPVKNSADPYYTALKLTKPDVTLADTAQDRLGAVALVRSEDVAQQDFESQLTNDLSDDANGGNPYLKGLHLDLHKVRPRAPELPKVGSAKGNPYLQGFDLDAQKGPSANTARSLLRKSDKATAHSHASHKKAASHWKDKLSKWLDS